MQMKIKMGKRRRVLLGDCFQDKFPVGRRYIKHRFERLNPCLIDLLSARFLIAVTQMQAHIPDQFLGIARLDRFF